MVCCRKLIIIISSRGFHPFFKHGQILEGGCGRKVISIIVGGWGGERKLHQQALSIHIKVCRRVSKVFDSN